MRSRNKFYAKSTSEIGVINTKIVIILHVLRIKSDLNAVNSKFDKHQNFNF